MRACRQSSISRSLPLFPQFYSLFSPSSPLFPPQGDKDPGDLNHKLTIKNVQLTPRSVEDRWNRLDPAHHRRLSFHRNEARAAGIRGRGGLEGEKAENSRELGSNREGLIPLDCAPCLATSAYSPPTPFSVLPVSLSLRYLIATFPPLLQPTTDTQECARLKRLFFPSARNHECGLYARMYVHM